MRKGSDFGVVILAAGASRRMGRPKSSLKYSTQRTFVSRLVEVYSKVSCDHIVVVANPDNALDILVSIEAARLSNVKLIINEFQDRGRTYSLQLGIGSLKDKTDFCFVQDVDRPSILLGTLQLLGSMSHEGHWSFLKYENRKGHPVLISRKIMEYISDCNASTTALSDVLSLFPSTGAATKDPAVVLNINTPEEYEKHFGVTEFDIPEK